MKRIVVVPDLQCPFEDRRMVDAVSEFIEDYKPDEVACVGDEADLPMLSRYSRGVKEEFSGDIAKHRDRTVEVLRQLKVTQLSRSNHGQRLWTSIATRLPGLMGLPELEYEEFFRHKELGITFHRDPYKIAPNWYLMHGDEGPHSRHGGQTSLALSRKIGGSVVCGHVHRLAVASETEMVGSKVTRIRTGFEVGHLIDVRTSGMAYMRGMANWQPGFGLLLVDGQRVTPVPVPIVNRSFVVEGAQYRW